MAERVSRLRVLELRSWSPLQGGHIRHLDLRFSGDEQERFSISWGGFRGAFAPRLDLPQPPAHEPFIGDLMPWVRSLSPSSLRRIDVHFREDAQLRETLARFHSAELSFVPAR